MTSKGSEKSCVSEGLLCYGPHSFLPHGDSAQCSPQFLEEAVVCPQVAGTEVEAKATAGLLLGGEGS